MQFIQFGMLGALAALAIPIIIHLMFRQRARAGRPGDAPVPQDRAPRQREAEAVEALAPAGAAAGVRGPDRLPVRPAVPAGDRAVDGRPPGRGAARPLGQHGTARGSPADRPRAGRGPGDPGAGRPGTQLEVGAVRPRGPARRPADRLSARRARAVGRRHRLRRGDGLGARPLRPLPESLQGTAHPDRPPALRARPGRAGEPARPTSRSTSATSAARFPRTSP